MGLALFIRSDVVLELDFAHGRKYALVVLDARLMRVRIIVQIRSLPAAERPKINVLLKLSGLDLRFNEGLKRVLVALALECFPTESCLRRL